MAQEQRNLHKPSLPPGGRGTTEVVEGARATSVYCKFHQVNINEGLCTSFGQFFLNEPAPYSFRNAGGAPSFRSAKGSFELCGARLKELFEKSSLRNLKNFFADIAFYLIENPTSFCSLSTNHNNHRESGGCYGCYIQKC